MAAGELTMLLVGDVFIKGRAEPAGAFQHVGDLLRSADFTLGNLEGAYADCKGAPWPKGGSIWASAADQQHSVAESGGAISAPSPVNDKSDARHMSAIASAGFDAMGVANNHAMDFGYDPLFETLERMEKAGIAHAGAGRSLAEAHAPAIVERKGCRVALLAYTSIFMPGWQAEPHSPGLAVMRVRTTYEPPLRAVEVPGAPPKVNTALFPEDKEQLAADIQAARDAADIVVCSFHWGVSGGNKKVLDYQVELGRHAIESGADLVFGHHSHLLHGIEVYKGRPIFYSLGNFSFASHDADMELETMIVRCRIAGKKIVAVEYFPVRSDEKLDPHVLDLESGRDIVAIVAERSKGLGAAFAPNGETIRIAASTG